jgi:4,5-DOPA dioxygenase extradiol
MIKQKISSGYSKMPVLFIGHGSPMNIIARNAYTHFLQTFGPRLPVPQSILVISAHWQTQESLIQASPLPKIIYDFGGFPEQLYQVPYPVAGNPILAHQIHEQVDSIKTTETWGIDHGAWSILVHLFPLANIPVLQLSIKHGLSFREHYELAQRLRFLREQGVLIIASGNLVHNLYEINPDIDAPPLFWAKDFHNHIRNAVVEGNWNQIEGFLSAPSSAYFQQAHPSTEHYLPLAYALGASDVSDHPLVLFDEIQNSSISMLSFLFEPSTLI